MIMKQGSLFHIPSTKPVWNAPSGEITMTSYPVCNKTSFSRKPCIPEKSYYGTLSGSHGRSFRIRHEKLPEAPLAKKSRWRHIRFAIKLRYLRNHALQIKSYYWSLSGSYGHAFRIRHEKLREAPPGGGLTITSYPVGNTTSLSRKPYIANKKLLWNAIMKS